MKLNNLLQQTIDNHKGGDYVHEKWISFRSNLQWWKTLICYTLCSFSIIEVPFHYFCNLDRYSRQWPLFIWYMPEFSIRIVWWERAFIIQEKVGCLTVSSNVSSFSLTPKRYNIYPFSPFCILVLHDFRFHSEHLSSNDHVTICKWSPGVNLEYPIRIWFHSTW